MKFLKKPVVLIAGLVLAIGAVVGYFTLGPGSGDGYSNDYNVTENHDGHNHEHESYGVR